MIIFPELYTIYFMCLGNEMSVSSWQKDVYFKLAKRW